MTALAGLLLFMVFLYFSQPDEKMAQPEAVSEVKLVIPELSEDDYAWIASRIFQNETGGETRFLTYWGAGEDFPSFGIGHFIWFPSGVDAPFDETFPAMATYVAEQGDAFPSWMQDLESFDAPWTSKADFDQSWSSSEMSELRAWLEKSGHLQARFIVSAFQQRWQALDLPTEQKSRLTGLLQHMLGSARGLFAVVDYFNFKGLGNNLRERYQDDGWGLVQVLETLPPDAAERQDMVELFRDAAADRLSNRVKLAPKERNESRWLEGWLARLDGYLTIPSPVKDTEPGFRVRPYLQHPTDTAVTLMWFSHENQSGQLTVWDASVIGEGAGRVFQSSPQQAPSLEYHPEESCGQGACSLPALPFQHEIRVEGLEASKSYRYQVIQNEEQAKGEFQTPGKHDKPLRFIVYADSETEPESTGKHAKWPGKDKSNKKRRYLLDQTTGYARNLEVIQQRKPAFVAIAGDLVESGGEQRDWDEFWRHNATLAASSFIIPALGNHEYYGGPRGLGAYGTSDSERSVQKYKTYFDVPLNNSINTAHSERYYALKYGAVTLLVLDTTDGFPHRSEQDSNWRLKGEQDGGVAPDWHPGSAQYRWLKKELIKARENSQFTFVMFHAAPYTSGVHGQLPGEGRGRDTYSGRPIQALTPLFFRFGVDAVFNGHDEMYEHSVVTGEEVTSSGGNRKHSIHFYDIGIGGDGLRGPVEGVLNVEQVYLAHTDAAEVYSADGVLLSGGKHYGHLEINIDQNRGGQWQATIDAVHIFPLTDASGQSLGFERRLYDDSITLISE